MTPTCRVCGTLLAERPDHGLLLCPDCASTVHRISHPVCPICGDPSHAEAGNSIRCGTCRTKDPSFDRARAAFAYTGAMRRLIMSLKYGLCFDEARPLGRIMAATVISEKMDFPDVVVPVPLTVPRMVKRGYNQAARLGLVVARCLRRPLDARMLVRVRDPGPQDHHSRAERLARVRGCFAVKEGTSVNGKSVLLVDDVLTTGATASECAGVLKKAGARRVEVIACTRAVTGA